MTVTVYYMGYEDDVFENVTWIESRGQGVRLHYMEDGRIDNAVVHLDVDTKIEIKQ